MNARRFLLGATSALGMSVPLLRAEPLSGGDFSLVGGPVSGGGESGGGTFALAGSAGGTATDALIGGAFEVTGGLIGIGIVPGDVVIQFESTDGQVTLRWSTDAADHVLESASQVDAGGAWRPVAPAPAGNVFTTPFDEPLRFFRLRKP